MFYTLIEMFVYNLMLPFHKIWDITKKTDCDKAIQHFAAVCYNFLVDPDGLEPPTRRL